MYIMRLSVTRCRCGLSRRRPPHEVVVRGQRLLQGVRLVILLAQPLLKDERLVVAAAMFLSRLLGAARPPSGL